MINISIYVWFIYLLLVYTYIGFSFLNVDYWHYFQVVLIRNFVNLFYFQSTIGS